MADGSYYEGEFEEGEIEGHGYRFWASSGNKYSGEFHMGELHGQGVMTYYNGAVYEGEWFRNKRQGVFTIKPFKLLFQFLNFIDLILLTSYSQIKDVDHI